MKNEEPMRNINPFGLRLQPELKARLEAASKHNRRSLNAEISARLEESFAGEPQRQPLSEHDAAIHTLTAMYQETLDRIAEWKNSASSISEMEKIELMQEEATARYLRHAIARVAMPPDERPKRKKGGRPLGIDTDVHAAAMIAENVKPTDY